MRHSLHFTSHRQITDTGAGPVCEADVVTTGFQLFGPFLVSELLSMDMTPSEILDALLMADLADSDLEILMPSSTVAH